MHPPPGDFRTYSPQLLDDLGEVVEHPFELHGALALRTNSGFLFARNWISSGDQYFHSRIRMHSAVHNEYGYYFGLLSHDWEFMGALGIFLNPLNGLTDSDNQSKRCKRWSQFYWRIQWKPFPIHHFGARYCLSSSPDTRVPWLDGKTLHQSIKAGLRHAVKSNSNSWPTQRGGDWIYRRPQPHLLHKCCRFWVHQERLSVIKEFEWQRLATTALKEHVLKEAVPINRQRQRCRQAVHEWDPIATFTAKVFCQ